MADKVSFPAWRYPPDGGEGRIFQKDEVVPKGWTDNPKTAGKKAPKQKGEKDQPPTDPVDKDRLETLASLRDAGVEIADDASDEEINAAIDKLTQ